MAGGGILTMCEANTTQAHAPSTAAAAAAARSCVEVVVVWPFATLGADNNDRIHPPVGVGLVGWWGQWTDFPPGLLW